MASRTSVFTFIKEEARLRNVLLYVSTFLALFITAKFGQYLFYGQNTSPALIWPPFGIALGAILIGGYRMWLPIALAELLAVFTAGVSPLPVILAATIGQTLQPVIGAWLLNRFQFDRTLSRVRDAFLLIGATFLIAMISPSVTVLSQVATHSLTATIGVTWVRTWAGGVLSILILTPLITVWLPDRPLPLTRFKLTEVLVTVGLLAATIIFIFWTPYASNYGLISIYVLLAILVWLAIRMDPRILTLGLFLLTVLGMGGAFYYASSTAPLNTRLFSDELLIEFFAIIFLVFVALIEERRRARIVLEQNVAQLSRALQRIESEDIAKNQFIATLAHELRNPLAPIVSAFDLLTAMQPSQETLQIIEGAQRELNLMRRLLDDILDVARLSQTRFKLQKEVVDVRPLLERSVESTRMFLRNRNHTLTLTLPEDRVLVDVDPVRFQQIVVNLLNNAGKYTPPGGKIELSCEKAGTQTMIRVRDNGVGIPQTSLQEVFEPFRQIRPTPQIGTGLGIGLWLTKQLVDMHGGRIEAQSEGLERGSCFTIYLPLKEISPSLPGAPVSVSSIVPSYKVLIVDDNEAAALAMQRLLRLKGHQTRAAFTGRAGITETAVFAPQVILLDIGLPDMSGYEVAKLLRDMQTNATLIALTGYGQDEDKQKAVEAGFDYHLTKPVGIASIEEILGKISS